MLAFHSHQQRAESIGLKQWQKLKVKQVLHRKLINYLPNDVGSWPGKATEEMRDFREQQGSEECQLLQNEYTNSISQKDGNKLRFCTSTLFRSWLCCSPGKGKLYCFVYKFFDESRDDEGFKFLQRIKMFFYH